LFKQLWPQPRKLPVINSNCTWVNLFDHDYIGSEAETFINDSAFNYGQIYLQSMAGLRAHTRFEFSEKLLELSEDGVSINKAELKIPVSPNYIAEGQPIPGSIQIFNALKDGTNDYIGDIFLGEEYYGGYYDENTGLYTFNLAMYVQDLLSPELEARLENTGLFITIKDARISGGQVKLYNFMQGEKMSLDITYTVVN